MLDRQARLAAALALVLSSAGACSLVLPFGELQTGSTGAGGGTATSSSGSGGGCEKQCKGECVGVDNPEHGCNAPSCAACPDSGFGATCAVHVCVPKPVELASGLINPWAVAVDDKNAYWSEEGDGTGARGGIHRADKKVKGKNHYQMTNTPNAQAVALNDTFVYFSTFSTEGAMGNGIWFVAKTAQSDGEVPIDTVASGEHSAGSIAVVKASGTQGKVYWPNVKQGVTVDEFDAAPKSLPTFASDGPHSLVVANEVIFFSEAQRYGIGRMAVDGGQRESVFQGTKHGTPGFIAFDMAHIYVSGDGAPGAIFRVLREPPGSEPDVIDDNVTGAGAIAVDLTYVYWASLAPKGSPPGTPGFISRHPLGPAGSTETLARPAAPRGICIDPFETNPSFLYFLDAGADGRGTLSKIALPH